MTEQGWTVPTGGNAFPFDTIGAWVKIKVAEFEPNLQVTDLKTGEAKMYKSGAPILMHRIGGDVLESSVPEIGAGSASSVYMSGAMKPTGSDDKGPYGSRNAVIAAAIKKATGGNQLMPGSELTVQYVGDEPDTERGMSATKRYRAWYSYQAPALGAVGPTSPGPTTGIADPPVGGVVVPPATGTPGPAPASRAVPAPAAGLSADPAEAAAQAALDAYLASEGAAATMAWEADPRVAPLRAKGLDDQTIRSILKI